MTIYIDFDFKCHTENDGTMQQIETAFFDGKCDAFVQGYRFVPSGEVWVREDGAEFPGKMIAPWKSYDQLAEIQAAVDEAMAPVVAERDNLLDEMQSLIDEVLGGETDV